MPELGEPISERELDVLNCLAEGASNREIADRLSISHNTVKVHVRNIFTKLGVSSRTEATTVALQKGMLTIPGMVPEPVYAEEAEDPGVAETGAATLDLVRERSDEIGRTDMASRTLEPAIDEVLPQKAPRNRASRRLLLSVIGVLGLLVLVLAANSLLGGTLQTPATPTGSAENTPVTVAFEETALGENWVESRAMPEARSRMALATVGLNLYAIGGENATGVDNEVFIFDSQQQQWREGAPKLTAVGNAAAGVLAGEVYVAGGYGANGAATTAVEAYSPLNNAWRPVTALPRPLAGAAAIVSDGMLYLFGGEDGDEVLSSSYAYDPGLQQWQTLPPMPTARTMAVGGVLGGKLYVVGGSDGSEPLAVCESFDPLSETWSDCPPLNQGRAAAGSAFFLNKLYVLGGMLQGEPGEKAGVGEVYDAAAGTWETFAIPMLEDAQDWPYLGVSNVETHIYAVGGEQGGELSDALYVYRPLVYQFFIPAASAGGE